MRFPLLALLAACGGHVETLEEFRDNGVGDTGAPTYSRSSRSVESPAPDASNEARITSVPPLATCIEDGPCSRLGSHRTIKG
jgi:hypothetical protein